MSLSANSVEEPEAVHENTDDEAVQSQIALEQVSGEDQVASKTEESAEERMDISFIVEAADVAENEGVEAPEPAQPAVQKEQAVEAPAATGKFEEIMSLLRGGLSALRSAELSRDEVYRVEDMFMDMKRELFEAERRGRN